MEPKIFLSHLAESCIYKFTPEYNRIMSPGYPNNYPRSNIVCQYFFEVTKGKAISYQFSYMSLNAGLFCGDFIKFYDLISGMEKKLCRSQTGDVWITRGNKALMTFKFDSSLTSNGFSGYFFESTRREYRIEIAVDCSKKECSFWYFLLSFFFSFKRLRHVPPPLASEIQKIFGNFKTLYQLRMCMITSCDLNISVHRKNIKLCPPIESLPTTPLAWSIHIECDVFVHWSHATSLNWSLK